MIITKNNLVKKLNYGIYEIYIIDEKIKYSDLLEIVSKIPNKKIINKILLETEIKSIGNYPRSIGKSCLNDIYQKLYLKPIIIDLNSKEGL